MPDEFPTLEAVLVIGTLVALARTSALWSGLSELMKIVVALHAALRARELGGARKLCERAKGATVARFGQALVDARGAADSKSGSARSIERALSRTRAKVRRGQARDLVALAVLVGAGAYAERAELDVSRWFYGLLATALALIVLGGLLRQKTLDVLVAAAADAHPTTEPPRGGST